LAWHVLNTRVRPFTAKWHRRRETLAALDATDIFRAELARLQEKLSGFDDLLVAIRDGEPPPEAAGSGGNQRDAAIVAEMAGPLEWGIHARLGGLDQPIAQQLNDVERAAILRRREHYQLKPRPAPAAATEHGAAAPPADPRPYAVALALSGGGIRSATFSLGVLIALARRNLLHQFDYLSTVSGGGYLGSFLTAFLNSADPSRAPQIGLRRD